MTNTIWNGVTPECGNTPSSYNGLISIPGVSLVRRQGSGARYEYLNPGAGCREWPSVTIQPGTEYDEDGGIVVGQSDTAPLNVCEADFQNAYIMLQPEIQRAGASMRFTANISENSQIYAMANFYKTDTFAQFTPLGFNGTPPPPNPATLATANVFLPVYVCDAGVGTPNGQDTGCDATNGILNPDNPYASEGVAAQVLLRSPRGRAVETSGRALRGVLGIEGSF